MNPMQNLPHSGYRESQIDLAGVLRLMMAHKWRILAVVATFTAVGSVYALMATPKYQPYVMLQVEARRVGIEGRPEVNNNPTAVSLATGEIELIKSRAVLGKVVTDLNLDTVAKPRYVPLIGSWMARTFSPEAGHPVADAPLAPLARFAWGGEQIQVSSITVPESLLGQPLTLVAGDAGRYVLLDKQGAQLLEGNVGQTASGNGVTLRVTELQARPGTEFSVMRKRQLATALEYQDRLKVTEAGKDSGIVYMSLEDADPARANQILNAISDLYVQQNVQRGSAEAAQRVDFLKTQLPLVRAELEKSENALHDFQVRTNTVDIPQQTRAMLDQVVNLDATLADLTIKRTDLARLYTGAHPAMQSINTQVAQIERQKSVLQARIQALPEAQQELLRLTRDMQVTNQTYTTLLNKIQEQEIMRAGNMGNVHIIDRAEANVEEPTKPMRKVIIALSLLAGLLVSVAWIFLRQAMDRRIGTPRQIEYLGLPVYASLPWSRQQERLPLTLPVPTGLDKAPLLGLVAPAEAAIESLRGLRTTVSHALAESSNRVLAVSSPTPAAGKSFVCTNLALLFAQSGKRVLLIDADLRKGCLHRAFGLAPRHGLTDVLCGRSLREEVTCATGVTNLDLIATGFAVPNPSELLMQQPFQRLLEDASQVYDLVLIDTPPVLAVTDACVVGQLAAATLLVARCARNSTQELEACRQRLANSGVMVLGSVFNGVTPGAADHAYASTYYYASRS